MVKIVVKKEGATQICGKCGTDLICRLRDYGGAYGSTLQWQNYDGAAHFKTNDGKNYSCNVPEEEEQTQTRIPTSGYTPSTTVPPPATTPGVSPPSDLLPQIIAIKNTVENIELHLQRMDEMVQAIFRNSIDEQLKKK